MTTITPTAIDAFVHIEVVRVVGRHRKDLGDLGKLANSIEDVGLLNPITLTRDSRLVAGQRRLEACRLIGWDTVPVRFVDSLDDAARLLRAERDENTERKEMYPSELASLGEALYEIEARAARERQGTRTDLGCKPSSLQGGKSELRTGETGEIVGEALGMSRSTYADLRFTYKASIDPESSEEERELGRQALAEIDRGRGIQPVTTELRRKLRAKREAQEAEAAAIAEPEPEATSSASDDPDWIPTQGDSSARAAKQRRRLIRGLAAQGHTSTQIGKRLGILAETVRRTAREHSIKIPADEALGRGTRKSIDSNRIVRETVNSIEGLMLGLSLVDFDALDRAEIENWTASLSASIKTLRELIKKMSKERAQ